MSLAAELAHAVFGTVVIWLALVWVWVSSSYSQAHEQPIPALYKLRILGCVRRMKRVHALPGLRREQSGSHAHHSLDLRGIVMRAVCWLLISTIALPANLTAGNNVTINAIGGNITGTGAAITATNGAASLIASGDVNLNSATTQHSTLAESFNASKGFLSSKSALRESDTTTALAEGSSVSGKTVAIIGGRDVNINGSAVVSDNQTTISAARDVNITAATETLTSNSFAKDKKSGLGALGGISYGKREQSTDSDTTATRAATSNIASLQGNVSISAGQTYNQVGSNVMAPVGNIDITAKTVSITEARETNTSETEQKFKQSGISVNATGAIATAIHTIDSLAEQVGKAKDSRMQGLAALAGAVEAKKALDGLETLAKDPTNLAGVGISISLGSQKNQSNTQSQSNTAAGSTVAAGGNVTITAQGAGDNSNITVQGSNISAANTTSLKADGHVNLLAAQNTSEQHSQNSGSSASIGVGITLGDKTGISFNASASTNKGNSDGNDLTHVNTQVSAGNTVNIQSGGDTTLKGAVVAANTVNAAVGGDLKIESLQDTAKFDEKQANAGFGVTLCIPPLCVGASSATVTAGKTTINSNYQSVGEQSGIKAGDGGFSVNVLGATDLKGGVISSTDKALQDGKNSFASAGGVTLTNIQNSADYKAGGFSVTAGYSGAPQDGNGNPVKDNAGNVIGGKPIGGGGFGSEKGSASSTTQTGITGIAGNTAARTGDAETGIKPIFDANAVRDNVNAQISITSTALPVVAKGWADYASEQERTATTQQDKACWAEGGACRVAGHVAIGALAGGAGGAAGAGASQFAVPSIGDALKDTNLPDAVKQVIVAGLGTAIGAATGGVAGAVTGGNATVNNYLTQDQWKAMASDREKCKDDACRREVDARYTRLSQLQDNALATCDVRGDCAALVKEVSAGTITQLDLVSSGKLPEGFMGAGNLQQLGTRLAANPTLRIQVTQAITAAYVCEQNPKQCSRQAATAALTLTGLVGATVATSVVATNAARIAVAAGTTIDACLANPLLCANQAGLAVSEFLVGDALGGASVASGAAAIAASKKLLADAQITNNFYRDGAAVASVDKFFESPQNKQLALDAIVSRTVTDFSNAPLRVAYEAEVRALGRYETMAQGVTDPAQLKQLAQEANEARRQLGVKYKDATPEPLRDYIYYVNDKRYEDVLGPTYEYLRGKNKTDMEIIRSASTPNASINSFMGNFTDWLTDQKNVRIAEYLVKSGQ